MSKPIYIAVAGNIGCGKSTLVDFICRHYQVTPFFEPNASNPYLVDFYGDMNRWAFQSQLYFLTHKFRIHRELEAQRQNQTVIQDRTIFEDAEIFAAYLKRKRCISPRDWAMYQDLYGALLNAIEPPDLMIYLRASVSTLRKRIKRRRRPEEQSIPAAYLRALNELYERWFAAYDRSNKLVLEVDRNDYVCDLEHRIVLLATIDKYVKVGAKQRRRPSTKTACR